MNEIDTYSEYLQRAFDSVIEASLEDESLNVLKELDNKTFYTSRIQEIFTEVYSAEREKQLMCLMEQVEELKQKNEKKVKYQNTIEYIERPCLKCPLYEKAMQQKQPSLEQKVSKDRIDTVIKQNELLSQELRDIQQKHLEQLKGISYSHEIAEKRLIKSLKESQENYESVWKKYKDLKEVHNQEMAKLQETRIQVITEKQKNNKMEMKMKENSKQKSGFCENNEKLVDEISNYKQYKTILQDKVRRLEDSESLLKQKLFTYENQLKYINENLSKTSLTKERESLDEETGNLKDLNGLVTSLTGKQFEISRLLREKKNLECENSQLHKEMSEIKILSEKSISELRQNLNRTTIEYERQLRTFRDKEKNNSNVRKQQQFAAKLNQMQDLKERVISLEEEKNELENKARKLEHSNQVLMKNYEQITMAVKNQQSLYEEKINDYEEKLENYRRLEKQLSKRAKMRDEADWNMIEKEFKEKVKFYETKLQEMEKQLQETKRSEQRMARDCEISGREQKNKTLSNRNNELILKEHELVLKVNDLETLLAESKMAAKELNDKKDDKIRNLKKQTEEKDERIAEISYKLESETKMRMAHEKCLFEKEKVLRQEQQKIVEIQERNQREMIETMKNHENKEQELTKQFEKYYGTIAKNKSDLSDKSSVTGTLRNLEKEYQNKISTMEEQWAQLRSKNRCLEEKYKQSEEQLKDQRERLQFCTQELLDTRKKESTLQQCLQKQKNNEVKIVKYYENKIKVFKNVFKEFKFEICHQFMEQTMSMKTQVSEMKKKTLQTAEIFKRLILNTKYELDEKIVTFQNTLIKRFELTSAQSKQQTIDKLKSEKQQIVNNYENKLKQKQMDLMTIVAEKQYLIEEVRESEQNLRKKYTDLENTYKKVAGKVEKSEQSDSQLKEIVSKMETKVDEAERNLQMKEKEVIQLQRFVDELSERLKKSEILYKNELSECREKYREENERMFNRFERQFNKVVAISSKKSKEKPSLAAIVSSRTFEVPTKGSDEDKISKLKREIQQQKKLVEELENNRKF